MNEFQQVLQHLRQPEYVHVLLNPLPVYATAVGLLALLVAIVWRSRPAQIIALLVLLMGCAAVWPVIRYGQAGYDRVFAMSNTDAQCWLQAHMERAEHFAFVFYLTAALAGAAIVLPWRFPKSATPLAAATLVLAAIAVGVGGWISHAGGQVRHSEFRNEPPPQHEENHEHRR
jgi:glucan phosphoethanolaminetransferase (alkaline phosphatase superfamily)